jgi:hypothetical protein
VGNSSGDANGSDSMKDWEIIADNLSKAGWSWGCLSAIDPEGRIIWIADAHRDGKRYVVRMTTDCVSRTGIGDPPRQSRTELGTKEVLATQFAPHGSQAEQNETEETRKLI